MKSYVGELQNSSKERIAHSKDFAYLLEDIDQVKKRKDEKTISLNEKARLKEKDDAVRGPAWQAADRYGAPAVKPLVALLEDPDMETARCARRALGKIVSHAGSDRSGKTSAAIEREKKLAEIEEILGADLETFLASQGTNTNLVRTAAPGEGL